MRKQYLLSRNSGTYTSPGTPDYRTVGEIQKGWCSERVPLPSTNKRHVGASALMPFNSGRTLPSKWDDAERWITSPVSASGINKNVFVQPQRQPKSKSGPLGPQAVGCFSNYSPTVPVFQGGSVGDFTVGSPFSTGVLVPDCVQLHYGSSNGGVLANTMNHGNAIDRATSLPGWSNVLSESSIPKSQDDKFDDVKDVETLVSRDISRRDMATQMSPRDSQSSSPIGRLSFSTSPPAADLHNNHSDRMEVKDLQIDNRASMTSQPVKNGVKKTKNDVTDIKVVTSSWEIMDASRNMSKLRREEAKISAWENLQKAKAEAAIQKLEMKLEKRRSATMDKILNRLRNAQLKAQDMRNTASNSCTYPRAKNSPKATFFSTFARCGSLGGCFSCCAS